MNIFFQKRGGARWVASIEEAGRFNSEESARNHILKSNHPLFSTLKKTDFEVRSVEDDKVVKEHPTISITEEEANTAFDNFTTAINLLNDGMGHITSLITHYAQELSKYDLMEQDILHKIEFDTISGFMAVQLCKKLKEIRINRRECKDKIEFFKNIRDGGGQALIKSMTNYNANLENRAYSVRFLTEIFGGKEVVKNK